MLGLWTLAAAMLLAEPSAPRTADELRDFEAVPLEVAPTGCTLDLPGGPNGREYLAILGTPNAGERGGMVRIDRTAVRTPEPLSIARPTLDPLWRQQVLDRRMQLAARRQVSPLPAPTTTAAKFPDRRRFHLLAGDGDFQDAKAYQSVDARLAAVGKHCLIYVDSADDPQVGADTIAAVVQAFDEEVFPKAGALFGQRLDVDRDGKFAILFTHWLGKLSGGKVSLGGFVRGGDFYRDVEPPFSNRCDMLYLNSALKPGPHLRTLLAHEYVHAITFSEHVFGNYLPGTAPTDEEAWLNEAISHLAENLLGAGWTNLDYRMSAYLNAPHRYRLVVADYQRSGLFRNHGCRGATYLLLRWCADRQGDGLLEELTRTSLAGTENLETATRLPFAELFRRWTIALALQGLGRPEDPQEWLPSVPLRGRVGNYLLAGPRTPAIAPGATHLTLAATSFLPVRVRAPAKQTARVAIATPDGLPLQATLIALPEDLPEVELDVVRPLSSRAQVGPRRSATNPRVTPVLRHRRGLPVHWEWFSWERETPGPVREGERAVHPEVRPADEAFAKADTVTGDTSPGEVVELPAHVTGRLLFKAVGTDTLGRRIAAWAAYDPDEPTAFARR